MIYISASVFSVLYAALLVIVLVLYCRYHHECKEMAMSSDQDKEWPLVHKLMGRSNLSDRPTFNQAED